MPIVTDVGSCHNSLNPTTTDAWLLWLLLASISGFRHLVRLVPHGAETHCFARPIYGFFIPWTLRHSSGCMIDIKWPYSCLLWLYVGHPPLLFINRSAGQQSHVRRLGSSLIWPNAIRALKQAPPVSPIYLNGPKHIWNVRNLNTHGSRIRMTLAPLTIYNHLVCLTLKCQLKLTSMLLLLLVEGYGNSAVTAYFLFCSNVHLKVKA